MEGRGDDHPETSPVTRAHRQAVVRRLPLFAVCWLGTTAAFDVVLVLEGLLGPAGALSLFVLRLALVGVTITVCRAHREASWVVPLVVALCMVLGALSTAVFSAVHGKGDVLAFVLLTLYLASSICFEWGWRPAAVVLGGTVAPWLLAVPSMTFSMSRLELLTAIVTGSAVALAIAEGEARTFRAAVRNRLRQEQSKLEIRASRDAYREAAANAQAAREEAEAATRAKDDFHALCSHELRTPLATISLWTGLLGTGQLTPEKTRQALAAIDASTTQQARLISDLLDTSSIASGKLRLHCAMVDLLVPIRAAFDAVRPLADERDVRMEIGAQARPATVWGDAGRLQQIVRNLLSNAVKFTPAGGRVTLRLDTQDGLVRLVVEDTGEGIAPEFLPHAFERFAQADSSSTRRHGGLGLGLAIVRDLVAAHGGAITVTSAGRGRGTRFVVTLPVRPRQIAEGDAGHGEPAPPDTALAGVEVLVVEDDRGAREAIATVLGRYGAHVEAVDSAAAAREALERRRVDVLLTDLAMPEEDGYQLVAQLRRRGIGIPAAALTSFAGDEPRLRARALGFGAYLTKPIDPAELVAALATLARPRDAYERAR
jgi:signal transduction histidine kinase/ActR/RegA family two-component response regulator